MNQKTNKMESMPIPKLVINISAPLMISLLVQSLYNIVDGVYIARLGIKAIASVTLAFPVQMLMIAISVGTGLGVNSLVSRKIGEKNYDEVGMIATTGLILSVLFSLIFVVFGIFFARSFFELYTSDPQLVASGVGYLRITCVFSTGIFVATTVERLLQAAGRTTLSMIALITGAVINIVLNPILIHGYFGFPALGVNGAAIATVVGQWAAALLAIIMNIKINKVVPFKIQGFKMHKEYVVKILAVGIPSMVSQGMGSVMAALINNVLGGFSMTAVAFFGIYYRLQQFLFMPINGLSQGLIPIVGYNYGSKRGLQIKKAVNFSLILAILIMAAGTILFLSIPGRLLSIFKASPEMLEFGVHALRIVSAIFIPCGIVFIVSRMYIGMGNGLVNLINTFFMDLLTVGIIYILVKFVDIDQIWYAYWISYAIALSFSLLCLSHAYKSKINLAESI